METKEELRRRLRQLLLQHYDLDESNYRGLLTKVGDDLECKTNVVGGWVSEGQNSFPSPEFILKINERLHIPPNKIFGIAEPERKKILIEIIAGTEKDFQIIEQTEGTNWKEKYAAIPIAKDPISAGSPIAVRDDPDGIAIIYREWAKNDKNFTAIRVEGQSMEPTIEDGSIIGIDHSKKNQRDLNGKIVALRDPKDKDKCTIKRLHMPDTSPLTSRRGTPMPSRARRSMRMFWTSRTTNRA